MESEANCSRLARASVKGRTDERIDPVRLSSSRRAEWTLGPNPTKETTREKTQGHMRTSMKKGEPLEVCQYRPHDTSKFSEQSAWVVVKMFASGYICERTGERGNTSFHTEGQIIQ